MELQVEKYKNLIGGISFKYSKHARWLKADFEQELWLKLYEFIRDNSGEAENFPLIKTVLRNHLISLIRLKGAKYYESINILILRGVDLVYDGFAPKDFPDPYKVSEIQEIGCLINEWFNMQNETTRRFVLESLLDSDQRISIYRTTKLLGMRTSKGHTIIRSLKKFLKERGVDHVFTKR